MEDEDDKTLRITVNPFQHLLPKGGGSASGVPIANAPAEPPGEPPDNPFLNLKRAPPPKEALGTPQRPKPEPEEEGPGFLGEARNVVSQIAEENIAPALGLPMEVVAGAPVRATRALTGGAAAPKAPPPPPVDLLGGTESFRRGMRNIGLSDEKRRAQTVPGKLIASTVGEAMEAPLIGGPVGGLLMQMGRRLPGLARFGAGLAKPTGNILTGGAGGFGGEVMAQTQAQEKGDTGVARALGQLGGSMAPSLIPRLRPITNVRPTRAELNAAARAKAGLPPQSTVDQAYEDLGLYQTAAEAGVTGPLLRAAETKVFPHTVGGGTLTAMHKASRDQDLLKARSTIAAAFGTPSTERLAGEAAQDAMRNAYKGERAALGKEYDVITQRHASARDMPTNTIAALLKPVTSATSQASIEAARSPALDKLAGLILAQNKMMSVGDLRAQKSKFGAILTGDLNAGIDEAQKKQIIQALNKDIEDIIKSRAPADYTKLKDIDKRYFENEDRFRRHIKEAVGTGKKAPSTERVFYIITNSAGTGGAADMAQLKTVWNTMPRAVQGEVSATILQRMGALDKAKPLDTFSVGEFIKNYRTISDDAKDLLWRNNPQQGKAIRDLETVVEHMQQTLPRYTTGGVGHVNPWGWGMQGAFNTLMFDPLTALVTIGGPAVAQFMLTNPTGVRMLAKSLRAGRAATDAALREFTTIQALPQISTPAPKVPADVISMYGARPGKDPDGNPGHYIPDPANPGKFLKLTGRP
jgi:hypothetical protein